MNFAHLHNHTQYSPLDGACKIEETLDRVKALGFKHYAITDHGNMFGAIHFYQECLKREINPIIGCEFYIASGPRGEKTKDSKTYHLVLLAENYTGYQNLLKLSSAAYLDGFYYKPRIDKDLLRQHAAGLFCLTACLKGEVAQAVLNKDAEAFKGSIKSFLDIFGNDRFFLEVQNHRIPEEDAVRAAFIKYASKAGLNLVATNDTHYLNYGDHVAHDALICIQTGKKIIDTDRMKYSTSDLYLKSSDEMYEVFKDCSLALENTLKIAEQCNVRVPLGSNLLPKFPVPAGKTIEQVFVEEVNRGLVKRGLDKTKVKDRLNFEYKTINKMGFASYFLIVQDFVRYAKNNGIPVGTCRGSVGGSLVAFCLGITEVNPLDYNLLFERFLNPDRISMPDIDMDFADRDRQKVIDYVVSKYGADSVSQIVTFGTMGARAVLRDVGRVSSIPLQEIDALAKQIDPKNSLQEELDKNRQFASVMARYGNLKDIALKLEDLNRHASIHAAGIIISPGKIVDHCPLMLGKAGEVASQYDMKSAEALGLLKMDFLGLRTLTVLDDVCKATGVDANKIPLDDTKTYELFSNGNTVGVFQFESSGMRDYLKRLKPKSIEDLAIMNALYRPGPLDAGMVDVFLWRREGKEKVSFLHKNMEPALKNTYGVIVYQEQVMQVVRDVAGFTLAEADTLRKAIGKKDKDLLMKQKELFLKGCVKNNVPDEVAANIFGQIETFARYGFNKSHAIGYSILAYQTAFMKANYPAEFMAALLSSEIGDITRVSEIIYECNKMSIEVLPPDINRSGKLFTTEAGKIRFSLNSIRNIGEDLCGGVIARRPFVSLYDFCLKVDPKTLNTRKLESLINAGCFDEFGPRKPQVDAIEEAIKLNKASRLYLQFSPGRKLIGPDFSLEEIAEREFDSLGIYLTYNPLDQYDSLDLLDCVPATELQGRQEKEVVTTAGLITKITRKIDKNKKEMAFLEVLDRSGQYEAVVFSSLWDNSVAIKDVVIIGGQVSRGKVLAKTITKLALG